MKINKIENKAFASKISSTESLKGKKFTKMKKERITECFVGRFLIGPIRCPNQSPPLAHTKPRLSPIRTQRLKPGREGRRRREARHAVRISKWNPHSSSLSASYEGGEEDGVRPTDCSQIAHVSQRFRAQKPHSQQKIENEQVGFPSQCQFGTICSAPEVEVVKELRRGSNTLHTHENLTESEFFIFFFLLYLGTIFEILHFCGRLGFLSYDS